MVLVALSLVLLLAVHLAATPLMRGSDPPLPLAHATLTKEAADRYQYLHVRRYLTVRAPVTNVGGETRQVYWPARAQPSTTQESCETWSSANGPLDQQGVALRIAPTADGRGLRAFTITKNVWMLGYWLFNVHVWDTRHKHPFTLLASFDVEPQLGRDVFTYPWHICARVRGDVLQFVVWTTDHLQPSWSDAKAVHRVRLPPGSTYRGRAGWYIGHLGASDVATFTDLWTTQTSRSP
ncbi:MAG TPA: hypothetical protein VID05_02280 [Acidimicrobiales bacterium]|jgi:hypothetical protein